MPKSWTSKDERKYEHIKDSELERGRGAQRAKQLGVTGRSRMTKQELLRAIRAAG